MKKALKIVFLVLFVFLIFAPPAVSGADCRDKAKIIYKSVSAEAPSVVGAKNVLLVFDVNGILCYRSHNRITQGDLILIGVYGDVDEIEKIRISVPTCNLEPTTPSIEDTVKILPSRGDAVLLKWTGECFDDEIKIQATKDNAPTWPGVTTPKQYKRFIGTFQVGVLCTDLEEQNFSTVDRGAGPVIRSDSDGSSGPQYFGSFVIYGLPHYLKSLFEAEKHYAGRDIINDNSFLDRLGLSLSIAIEHPEDTLGFGLAFEIVRGVSITGTQLYRRVSVLDGFSEGDAFTGSNIPTKKSWKNEFVWGVSIDGRYIAKFFKSANK